MENAAPDLVRRIYKEWRDFNSNPIEGIQLFLNEQDMTDLQALIVGPVSTPYSGGEFRLKLVIPEKYPIEPPKAFFLTKIFHPNVAPSTGEVCVNTLKMDWKSNLGLRHIFMTINCLLINPNPESALNEEAGKLLLEDYSEYFAQAKLLTEVHACKHLRKQTNNLKKPFEAKSNSPINSTALGKSNDLSRSHLVSKINQRNQSTFRKALKRL